MMNLQELYPKLSNFLGAWFSDASFDGLEDAEVVHLYLQTLNREEHIGVCNDLERLLSQTEPLPTEEISIEANRYFKGEAECRIWLSNINDKLNNR